MQKWFIRWEQSMKKRETDQKITEWFRTEAENIAVPSDMKAEIDRRIQSAGRGKSMKLFTMKKVAVVAVAVALLGSVTAVAAGQLASTVGHSSLNDMVKDYDKVAEMEKEVGFEFPALETFSNGFQFESATPGENSDYDQDGNALGSYTDIQLTYTDGSQDITVFMNQPRGYEASGEEAKGVTTIWEGEKSGIPLTVTKINHKFVPADYEKTAEDIQAEEEGSLVFAYGTSEVEETVSYNCQFEYNGLSYDFVGFDLTMQPEELAEMAAELAVAGE